MLHHDVNYTWPINIIFSFVLIYSLPFLLQRLATDKEMLEKDLGFKSQKMAEYSQLLESVRENNRQLQVE